MGRHEHTAEALRQIPWRQRLRRSLWDVQPARLILAFFAFPAMAAGVLGYEIWQGKRHDGWVAMVVLVVITLAQLVYLVRWFRRPVRGSPVDSGQ